MGRLAGAVVAAAAAAVAAIAAAQLVAAPEASGRAGAAERLPPATRAGETLLYGRIRTLTRSGGRFELRLDPAYWLSGVTAQRAAVADGVVRPGEPVPNDVYVRDESRRVLSFRVPSAARATVVTHGPGGIGAARISVAELAQIVKGRNPKRRPIFGRHLGFWIRVAADTVRSLDQQYHP